MNHVLEDAYDFTVMSNGKFNKNRFEEKSFLLGYSVWFYKLICIIWLTCLCMSLRKGEGKAMSIFLLF